MSITVDESIVGIWYCVTIPDGQDFLLALNRVDEGHFKMTYRFRYYNSDDPFDTEDVKKWYKAEAKGVSEKEIIETMRTEIVGKLAEVSGSEFTELLRGDRSLDEFMNEFMEQDFVHTKRAH